MLGVDPFEAVDIDEDERERALVALCAPRLGAKLLVESAVIGEVRQLIARRKGAQLGAGVGERDGRLRCESELEQSYGVAAFGDERTPEPGPSRSRVWFFIPYWQTCTKLIYSL